MILNMLPEVSDTIVWCLVDLIIAAYAALLFILNEQIHGRAKALDISEQHKSENDYWEV